MMVVSCGKAIGWTVGQMRLAHNVDYVALNSAQWLVNRRNEKHSGSSMLKLHQSDVCEAVSALSNTSSKHNSSEPKICRPDIAEMEPNQGDYCRRSQPVADALMSVPGEAVSVIFM